MSMKVPVQALCALLEDEKEALLGGKYDQLEGFANAKQRAVQSLQGQGLPQTTLEILQRGLAQNAALLGSAAQGFQDARHMLTRLRDGQDTQMYDRCGTSKTMRRVENQLERKA
ncbi:hypothetical protein [Roseinatronobacter monicus]|nr:hypothetical protein [Roseinatronobacter monicus]